MLHLPYRAGQHPLSPIKKSQKRTKEGVTLFTRIPLTGSRLGESLLMTDSEDHSALGGVLLGGMLVLRCPLLPWGRCQAA